jgi:hypothetical protein
MIRKRTDGNQAEIVKAYEQLGCTTHDASQIGNGFPDLIVAKNLRTWLVEVKMPGEDPRAHQTEFHQTWRGRVFVNRSIGDVEATVKFMSKASDA